MSNQTFIQPGIHHIDRTAPAVDVADELVEAFFLANPFASWDDAMAFSDETIGNGFLI